MSQFTHFDGAGNAVMVDVSAKNVTARTATAKGKITMSAEAFAACKTGTRDSVTEPLCPGQSESNIQKHKKGDVLGVARVAGIMAAKQTSNLIPLCHNLAIEKAAVDFEFLNNENTIYATCTVKCSGKTGVEMEALCGVSVALLTIYDMCKAIDKNMEIGEIILIEKLGGKNHA
jgi:cyclic pyranopterin phosphate synthase